MELDEAKLQVASELSSAGMHQPKGRGAGPSVVGLSSEWQRKFSFPRAVSSLAKRISRGFLVLFFFGERGVISKALQVVRFSS